MTSKTNCINVGDQKGKLNTKKYKPIKAGVRVVYLTGYFGEIETDGCTVRGRETRGRKNGCTRDRECID